VGSRSVTVDDMSIGQQRNSQQEQQKLTTRQLTVGAVSSISDACNLDNVMCSSQLAGLWKRMLHQVEEKPRSKEKERASPGRD